MDNDNVTFVTSHIKLDGYLQIKTNLLKFVLFYSRSKSLTVPEGGNLTDF